MTQHEMPWILPIVKYVPMSVRCYYYTPILSRGIFSPYWGKNQKSQKPIPSTYFRKKAKPIEIPI